MAEIVKYSIVSLITAVIIFTFLYFYGPRTQARDSVELEKYRVEAYRDILQTKVIHESTKSR